MLLPRLHQHPSPIGPPLPDRPLRAAHPQAAPLSAAVLPRPGSTSSLTLLAQIILPCLLFTPGPCTWGQPPPLPTPASVWGVWPDREARDFSSTSGLHRFPSFFFLVRLSRHSFWLAVSDLRFIQWARCWDARPFSPHPGPCTPPPSQLKNRKPRKHGSTLSSRVSHVRGSLMDRSMLSEWSQGPPYASPLPI